jgi:hypothetical protein
MFEKPKTHDAYALRKENRSQSRYIEIGHAHIDQSGQIHHIFLDRLPIGGFTGHVFLSPVGVKMPDPAPQPERPGQDPD